MATSHAARDERALAMFEFTTQLATLAPPPPDLEQLLRAIARDERAMNGFVSVVDGTVTPVEFFDPDNLQHLLSAPAR